MAEGLSAGLWKERKIVAKSESEQAAFHQGIHLGVLFCKMQ